MRWVHAIVSWLAGVFSPAVTVPAAVAVPQRTKHRKQSKLALKLARYRRMRRRLAREGRRAARR